MKFMKKLTRYYWKNKQKRLQKAEFLKYDGRIALMFHEVSDKKEAWYDAEYSITAKGFGELLEAVQKLGYHIVSPYELLQNDGKKKICVTFDDVFRGVYDNAFPVLSDCDAPFVVFPAVSFIGKNGYVDEEMIKNMMKHSGVYLGAHSVSHCVLKQVSEEQCRDELRDSKSALEKMFQTEIDIMAYPYGSLQEIGKREVAMAREHYRYAFSTLQTCITEHTDPHCIPRMNVNEDNYKTILEHIDMENHNGGI